jgi:hypothetical protein
MFMQQQTAKTTVDVAAEIVEAALRKAEEVVAPSGIGRPISVRVLGSAPGL